MSLKTPFVDAMRAQPEHLELARTTVGRSLDAAVLAPWRPGETVGIVAMGASSHSGHALVAVLAGAGVRAVNLVASELFFGAPGFQPADHYVLVSESGRSPEPIAAGRSLTDGRRIHLAGRGHMVNLSGPAPLGNSIESMDLGFALQSRCLEAVARGEVGADSVVVPVPRRINELVASAYLRDVARVTA